MSKDNENHFFSVSIELIPVDRVLIYDLYINSSVTKNQRFVRIYPKGEYLNQRDLKNYKKKYAQLYVQESQRNLYLKAMINTDEINDVDKTTIIKDSAIHYLEQIFDSDKEFTTEVLDKTVQGCRDTVEAMIDVLQDYDINGIQSLISNLSFHDFYTYDHSVNVSMYNMAFYRSLVPLCPRDELLVIGMGGLLHDLGKIKISTSILNNTGKLSTEQFEEIKKHPDYGVGLLTTQDLESVKDLDVETISSIVHEHHENYDGTGYPGYTSGENIHQMARITAIVDFFDAVTTKRSYHDVLPVEDAIHLMAKTKGKKIDPKLFEKFTQFVKVIVKSGKFKFTLKDAENFDSCMPHGHLELEEVKKVEEVEDFGKIKIVEEGVKEDEEDLGEYTDSQVEEKKKAS